MWVTDAQGLNAIILYRYYTSWIPKPSVSQFITGRQNQTFAAIFKVRFLCRSFLLAPYYRGTVKMHEGLLCSVRFRVKENILDARTDHII